LKDLTPFSPFSKHSEGPRPKGRDVIIKLMQLIVAGTGQEYKIRKQGKGAFWDRSICGNCSAAQSLLCQGQCKYNM